MFKLRSEMIFCHHYMLTHLFSAFNPSYCTSGVVGRYSNAQGAGVLLKDTVTCGKGNELNLQLSAPKMTLQPLRQSCQGRLTSLKSCYH